MTESIPPELFLDGFPPGIRRGAERLRRIVKHAVPEAMERVRLGWQTIGYDMPVGRRTRYFAFVWPEAEHVHLGFAHGVLLEDPEHVLEGAHLKLRQVRFLTYRPGQAIPKAPLIAFTREAARLATMSRSERMARELDRD